MMNVVLVVINSRGMLDAIKEQQTLLFHYHILIMSNCVKDIKDVVEDYNVDELAEVVIVNTYGECVDQYMATHPRTCIL